MSNSSQARNSEPAAEADASTRYGRVFPSSRSTARSGVARSDSIVPRSFSRTTASAVAIADVTIRMNATRPGTRKIDDRSSGLYQTVARAATGGGRRRSTGTSSAEVAPTIWRA